MTELLHNPKIKPEHLARKAIVYLRQSSDKQVRQNKESQLLLSTPEQKCIGQPEQKYITEPARRPPNWGLFLQSSGLGGIIRRRVRASPT